MIYKFNVQLQIPDGEWTSPPPQLTAAGLADELRHMLTRIGPTANSEWFVEIRDIGTTESARTFPGADDRNQLSSRFSTSSKEIEPQQPTINVDARGPRIHMTPEGEARLKYARCGNCGVRFPITDDPIENHHRAQAHKITCGKQDLDQYGDTQLSRLIAEFESQPNVVAMRERHHAGLPVSLPAASSSPAQIEEAKLLRHMLTRIGPPAYSQIAAAEPEPETHGIRAHMEMAPVCGHCGVILFNEEEAINHKCRPAPWWKFWK